MRTSKRKFEIRKNRVRSRIIKTTERLRLSVFKSGKHIYAQIIDDVKSTTLASASTLEKNNKSDNKFNCNVSSAAMVGELISQRASNAGITKVVFDKSGYKYHGVIKSLADAARKNLEF
ncbi:MAG: 50S ribosomal protein L18 [Rickettsiaceae bacterium]|nr:MAG: 50S ribosomal protein L18 [Rickettsiaceae bacterium]